MDSDFDAYLADLRRSLEQDLGAAPVQDSQPEAPPGVAFMITRQQRQRLRSLGMADEEIYATSPATAQRILAEADAAHRAALESRDQEGAGS